MSSSNCAPGPFPPLDAPVVGWAKCWTARGFGVVPLKPHAKNPSDNDWPNKNFGEAPEQYFRADSNLGVVDGFPNGNTDIDLDAPEAVRIWSEFGPPTNMRWGRSSKTNSHWMYRTDPAIVTVKFEDTIEDGSKATLLEVRGLKKNRSVGLQSMAPPSIHPSGEQVRFEPGGAGEPASVNADELERAARRCAAAALLVRHFPGEGGGRHDALLALAGLLCRAGWSEADALQFIRGMYRGLWDAEADFEAAATEASTTYATVREGGAVTGSTRLTELVGAKVLGTVCKWLGISLKGAPRVIGIDGGKKAAITDQSAALDFLSRQFRFRIDRILKYASEPAEYRMQTEYGEIKIKRVEDLIRQARLRARIVDAIQRDLPDFDPDGWAEIRYSLVLACEKVEASEDSTERGIMAGWLSEYLNTRAIHDTIEEADKTREPFWQDDTCCIYVSDCKRWLHVQRESRLTQPQITAQLRDFGAAPMRPTITIEHKETSRSFWQLPLGPWIPERRGDAADA